MTALPRSIGAITLFVTDVAVSKAWYLKVFDAPVVFEDEVSCVLGLDPGLLNLLAAGEAVELIAPAPVAAAHAGAQLQFTVWVADADAACEGLRQRGVQLLNGPIDRPWGQRTACVQDPDGHVWELAQHIS